ncbi:mannonate dehydratase [Mesorhizobium sp. B2-1-3A]|uniref:mannonate dehydratase n=1 Tax=Mesorhizobium sp. B2-1-3A TaxID=2589971 RepID=UPI001129188D|nr:mannonate dehydratase [Mesorhizobium sp. B2-1-3A]TPM93898.1 mannonate dehydratase [Mesorhizobium sp. B2-1-3A]
MEQTWRWFGEQDPIPLDHVKQTGATGVVTALHHLPAGQVWQPEEIAKRKHVIEEAGLSWSVCESIPTEDSIKRGDANARRAIDTWKDSLANLGRAGVPVVCYNFMPILDWTRTDLMFRLPTTGYALRFDMIDFVAYDVFMLKRNRASQSYDPLLVEKAEQRIAGKSEEQKKLLETNIIAGLPGGASAQTRSSISSLIESFQGIDDETMRGNLFAFLKEIVPVAEEFNVRLAIHPDDPPFPLFGLPRVLSTASDIRRLLTAYESPANGITLCTGSYGSRPDNDLVAITREFAHRVNFAHLRNTTVEPDGSFYEAEHLEGDTDMVTVIELLLREEEEAGRQGRRPRIPMRPDHGHLLAGDIDRQTNPGYSYNGRLKGLAELRGVIRALTRGI